MSLQAVGMIETKGLVPAIQALDSALKASDIKYVKNWRTGSGLVCVMITGDVASVKAAVDAGVSAANRIGEVVSSEVIARPQLDISKL